VTVSQPESSQSARKQPVSRKCRGGRNLVGQWHRRKKSQSADNRNKSKVSQRLNQSVSQRPISQPEVPWGPQLGGPVASSKEVQISRIANKVDSPPEVETVSQPETSQSAGSALVATIRWARGVDE